MEEEIEDIVGDVKYTDSQKSVATSNQYSLDFTDSSINSDKNNSSGKETYVIDLYDSEDSNDYSLDGNNKSVIHVSRFSNDHDSDTQFEAKSLDHKIAVYPPSTSKSNDATSQEIFTQTSKTIIELAQAEGVKRDLETQTSFMSISEKKVEYRIEVTNSSNNIHKNVMILSNNLEDGSSKFPESEMTESDTDGISEVSSGDRILKIINDENDGSQENVSCKNENDNNPSSKDFDESFDSDIEDDSLMERRPRASCIGGNHSDVSDIPKSIDNEIEELYTKLSERIDFRVERQGIDRRFTTLTPLTEESGLKRGSSIDITPDCTEILDSSKRKENDDIIFTNDAGMKVKLFPDRNKEEHFKLPPIQNRSCPNSPHLNFLFSLNTNSTLNKSGTLPCLHESSERKVDRWELETKDLASGESPRIRSRSESARSKDRDTIHLPPIHIEGFVVSSKINKTESHKSNVFNINPAEAQHDSISINEKIRELKIDGRKKPPAKVVSTTESRSCSPTAATGESRLCETAERGCEALCVELLRKLRASSWFETVDTLEEIPRVMDKFWNVISEQRIADLIRQVSIHIESPRTQVARAACSTIAAILKNTNYTKKPDFYEAVTLLLSKTGSFSRPVRRAANLALDEVVCGVDLSHAVTALCVHGVSHKSGAVRSAAARLLVVGCAVRGGARGGRGVLRARPPTAATARAHALRALATLLDDKNTDARKYAERLYSMLRPHSSFEAYYLTDVDVEVASRQMKKYDKILLCGPPKDALQSSWSQADCKGMRAAKLSKRQDFYEAVTLLLSKTGSFSRPVRRAANLALDEVVCGVDLSHAVTALCVHGVSHKSGAVRSAAARLLVVGCAVRGGARGGRGVLRARPPTAATARAHALRALATLLDDKNTDARKYAERLYSMLRPHSSFEAYYLTDVDVEVASRQMKKYDKILLCGPPKDGR